MKGQKSGLVAKTRQVAPDVVYVGVTQLHKNVADYMHIKSNSAGSRTPATL